MWRVPFLLTALSMVLVSCAGGSVTPSGVIPSPTVPPREGPATSLPPVASPPAGAEPTARDPVYIDEVSLVQMESYPVQIVLRVTGSLPTPCHEARWEVVGPDALGRIEVTLYSEADPSLACIQLLEPFEISVPLGSYTTGSFTVWLNGELVGEFRL